MVDELEHTIQEAIADALSRIGRRKLPVLPSDRTLHLMAKAAVAVYEAVVENQNCRDNS